MKRPGTLERQGLGMDWAAWAGHALTAASSWKSAALPSSGGAVEWPAAFAAGLLVLYAAATIFVHLRRKAGEGLCLAAFLLQTSFTMRCWGQHVMHAGTQGWGGAAARCAV